MTVARTIVSGVAVIILSGLIMGSVDLYHSVRANTEHRESSKDDEIYEMLIRIESNQKFLMKKYEADIKN